MEPAELNEMAHLNLQIGKNVFIVLIKKKKNVQDKLEEKWHLHVTSDENAVVRSFFFT